MDHQTWQVRKQYNIAILNQRQLNAQTHECYHQFQIQEISISMLLINQAPGRVIVHRHNIN